MTANPGEFPGDPFNWPKNPLIKWDAFPRGAGSDIIDGGCGSVEGHAPKCDAREGYYRVS